VHFNADEVRLNINRDLGFSLEDRLEQARRMGWLCDQVVQAGHTSIADFICPTRATRTSFGPAFVVFVDTHTTSSYADTNRLFEPPARDEIDCRIRTQDSEVHADYIQELLEKLEKPNIFEVD
jgi:adenylylsulfate kinase